MSGLEAGDRLLDLEAQPGEKVALRFPDRALTYDQLRTWAGAVAGEVAGTGRVAVWAEPRIETAVAIVAALLAGVPAIPINPRIGSRELAHVLGDSAPDLLLGASDLEPPEGTPRFLPLDPSRSAAAAPQELPAEPAPDRPALVVYTSGTTGSPKGVVLSRAAVAANLDALAAAWAWTGGDVVGHALPLFHVHGLILGVLGPLRRGGTVHHVGRFEVEAVQAALEDDVTVLFGVPTMYKRLADQAEAAPALAAALGRARLLVSGSAPLPAADHERIERIAGQGIVERYGMTETLMITSVRVGGDRRPGFVGLPVEGVELRVLDDDGSPVQAGNEDSIGEIEVRSSALFSEYLNRPDATAESFDGEWFRTGDLATIAADGYVRIVGRRATDLIKTGGYKVGAGEIEAALREHPAVDDAAVRAAPDPDLGERIVAWVVLEDGEEVEPATLSEHVGGLLAPHKRPREVRFIGELPRNELGKVQKSRLQ